MTPTNWRELCRELIESRGPDYYRTLERARKALADGPAVPEDREPASVTGQPSDQELLELMPETMRDEFAYAATTCSDATGGQVKPGIFRVCLNTAALEYARAVLTRWGHHPAPVPVSERLPGPEDCDAEGRCWWWYPPVPEQTYGYWIYEDNAVPERSRLEWPDSWLPAHALPLPQGEVE